MGEIYGINGPVLKVTGAAGFRMSEMVTVGSDGLGLIGEVISISREKAVVQVYEDTSGLSPGDEVHGTGTQLSVTLAPGIAGNIFDGIQRPLTAIAERSGIFISKGININKQGINLDTERKWETKVLVSVGDIVSQGDIIAEVRETTVISHKIMVPSGIGGTVTKAAADGEYRITDELIELSDDKNDKISLNMIQRWPIRTPRAVNARKSVSMPLITGQRVIDTLFPVAKGGMAALPGGFGTGKTITQHQLARYADADIVIYVGCGERGNEMTQVLEDFSMLKDPKTGSSLMDRTVLIANTSNMPVSAREASIYTGITIAEYYRDMGYHAVILADSTSRWAEALRELSGRLEEMPAEEGYPAYLATRLAGFYERAGFVKNLNGTEGSVTIIGAVSPQGNDFSEPVTQNTKRFIRSFWMLDKSLAYARHFPAIQWLHSYSEYLDDLEDWYCENVSADFSKYRQIFLRLLNEESELMEIVKLIGADVLPDGQKLTLEIARVIRLGYLQQNAYHAVDAYVPLIKQMKMMEIILYLNNKCRELVDMGIPVSVLKNSDIFEKIINIKYESNIMLDARDEYFKDIDTFYSGVKSKEGLTE